jgi:hypothetical protein
MADDLDRMTKGILGDINPAPSARDHIGGNSAKEALSEEEEETPESMNGGSREDRSKHAGSRDVTDGTTSGTEVGGTRNYRQGSGAAGSDIGNRPE